MGIVYMTNDNSDIQEIRDGQITDMRIEALLAAIFAQRWDEPSLDQLYTEVVQEFINGEAPHLLVTAAGRNPHLCNGVLFLVLLGLDFRVIHSHSSDWPGNFEYMPNATVGVAITGPNTESYVTPGVNLNHAAIGVIIQHAREISRELYNQGNLQLH